MVTLEGRLSTSSPELLVLGLALLSPSRDAANPLVASNPKFASNCCRHGTTARHGMLADQIVSRLICNDFSSLACILPLSEWERHSI